MTYTLGVDLGTTFTAAAIVRRGRASVVNLGNKRAEVPSVVVVREDGTVLTGEAAERRAVSEPDRVGREFKRRLGDTTPLLLGGAAWSAEALSARLLRAVVDDVAEREGGAPDAIAVSHPANWGPYKIDLLRQALQIAELDDAVLVTEPEAAAISYAHAERLEPGQAVVVYDLGGGTFDAAVLRSTEDGFELLGAPVGIERLGGIDFDAAVMGHVMRIIGNDVEELDDDDPAAVMAFARLRQECIDARESLSSDTEVDIPVMLPGVSTTIRLTRGELEGMVRPALGDSVAALRRAVEGAGVDVDDLHAVLLVGGASRTPLVASMVGAELGRPVVVDADPKHAVALGAAHHAAAVSATPKKKAKKAATKKTATKKTAAKKAASKKAASKKSTKPKVAPAVGDESVELDLEPSPTPAGGGAGGGPSGPSGPAGNGDRGVRSPKVLIGAGVAGVAILAIAFTMFAGGGDPSEVEPGAASGDGQSSSDTVDVQFVRATIDEGSMVAVNATDPVIGTDEVSVSDPPEYVPTRQLSGLHFSYVDVTDATNRQYYDFLSFTSALTDRSAADVWTVHAPAAWQAISPGVPATFDLMGLPDGDQVLGVSWEAANTYCTYALKRLVTEVEWELAAVAGLIDHRQNQDWVARSDEYGPVPDGAPVLRGSFGIEQLPITYRTFGDSPANRLNAGIRCAADDVVQVPRPVGVSTYVREFSSADVAFDWPDFHDSSVPQMAFGYHAPDVFHMEIRDQRRLAVMAGVEQGTNVSVQADVELRLPSDTLGSYRYGLVANAGSDGYLLFTVRPRASENGFETQWCVVRQSAPLIYSGPLFSVTPSPADDCDLEGSVASETMRNTLRIELDGSNAEFSVDGAIVGSILVPTDAAGAFGFVIENQDPGLVVHAHYDNLVVRTR